MKNKTFTLITMVVCAVIGGVTAGFIIKGNYIIPIITMVLGTVLTATLKMKVTDVITDERLDRIVGKAAKTVYIVTTYALALATVIFAALSKSHESYFGYSVITSSTVIGMLLLYMISLSYYDHKKD